MRLTSLLLAAGLVTGCDAGSLLTGSDCTQSVDQTIDLDGAAITLPVQVKVESCRLDVDACGALCTRVMADNNLGNNVPTPGIGGAPGFPDTSTFVPWTKCAVTFEGSTTHVEIAYSQFNGGPNCPQFGEGDVSP